MQISNFIGRCLQCGVATTLMIALASCHSGTEPVFIAANGRIVRGVESCFVIQSGDKLYRPTELPPNLQVEGIDVQFEATPAPDVVTFCGGTPIVLLHIERAQ